VLTETNWGLDFSGFSLILVLFYAFLGFYHWGGFIKGVAGLNQELLNTSMIPFVVCFINIKSVK